MVNNTKKQRKIKGGKEEKIELRFLHVREDACKQSSGVMLRTGEKPALSRNGVHPPLFLEIKTVIVILQTLEQELNS